MIVVKESLCSHHRQCTTTYARSDSLEVSTECFLQVKGEYTQHHLTFLNNRAGLGGNEL